MGLTTPMKISEEITSLCQELVPGGVPIYLQVTPAPGARVNDCFVNIERHLTANGGAICIGWQIWEWPRVLLEAEFHAVWKDQNGTFVDITPKEDLEKSILFLPDPHRRYTGKRASNVQRPLSTDPTVTEYIAAYRAESKLMTRRSRAQKHGPIALAAKEAQELVKAHERKKLAYLKVIERFARSDPR
jgi:hypothetical protein